MIATMGILPMFLATGLGVQAVPMAMFVTMSGAAHMGRALMLRPAAFVAALFLAACDGAPGQTLPDGVSDSDVALFKTTIEGAGCMIGPDQAASVKAQTGFSDEKLSIITQYLTLNGESTPTDSGFRLTSGSCANA